VLRSQRPSILESPVTVEKVIKLIFEGDFTDFHSYLAAMLAALQRSVDDIDDAALQVIQDAWNYFPHRFLNGRCPTEVVAKLS
jgi:hypothetical protein